MPRRNKLHRLIIICLLSGLVISIAPPDRTAHAATFNVDTTVDNGALSACTAAPNDCSLRGAVNAANAVAGPHTINVPAGTYILLSGQLTITEEVTIQGAGAGATIIDGNNNDRVFSVTVVDTTYDGVTIQGGMRPRPPTAPASGAPAR